MRTDFMLDTLEQALYARQPGREGNLVWHSNRGSQYVSIRYTDRLAKAGIEPSVGGKGDSDDNALAESINGFCKAELICRRAPWKARRSWSLQRSNGYRGSITTVCLNASGISRQQKSKQTITGNSLVRTTQQWWPDLNQTVISKAGTIQLGFKEMYTFMHPKVCSLRKLLGDGAISCDEIAMAFDCSALAVSDALKSLGSEVIYFSCQGLIKCALRDRNRDFLETTISRVDSLEQVQRVGVLVPVRPEGFVLKAENGADRYSEGLPWWLCDVCPQGYLGRIYVTLNAKKLTMPKCLGDWSDTHLLKALQRHGDDLPGNLLFGEQAEARFMLPTQQPIALANKAESYSSMADGAEAGSLECSWVAGEQPKFTTYVETEHGSSQVIVKFSGAGGDAATERWRDLLLAEHFALEVLAQSGVAAAKSRIVDHAGRRFLEVERFDRIGAKGRAGLVSLAALDAEFVGTNGRWYAVTQALEEQKLVEPNSARQAALLWAFGTLIGNDDMHNGNLSFIAEVGQPYRMAPAYDMNPMAFAPGRRPLRSLKHQAHGVSTDVWREALEVAARFVSRLELDTRFSKQFDTCRQTINAHIVEIQSHN